MSANNCDHDDMVTVRDRSKPNGSFERCRVCHKLRQREWRSKPKNRERDAKRKRERYADVAGIERSKRRARWRAKTPQERQEANDRWVRNRAARARAEKETARLVALSARGLRATRASVPAWNVTETASACLVGVPRAGDLDLEAGDLTGMVCGGDGVWR